MIILGIDPGTATTGYGVVEFRAGALKPIDYGTIRTSAGVPLPLRLVDIYDRTLELIQTHDPDAFAVEQLFFSRNAKSAFDVGHARGIYLLAAAQRGLPITEYTPQQVKQSVTGQGAAAKNQVAFMVRALLGLRETPRPVDAADALAVAICHAHHLSSRSRMEASLASEGVRLEEKDWR